VLVVPVLDGMLVEGLMVLTVFSVASLRPLVGVVLGIIQATTVIRVVPGVEHSLVLVLVAQVLVDKDTLVVTHKVTIRLLAAVVEQVLLVGIKTAIMLVTVVRGLHPVSQVVR
jgi:hypothetical protein